MDENERQRKLEAGRAKLASFRQKRAKSSGAGAAKKTEKGKSQAVSQNDCATQNNHVEPVLLAASDTELNSSGKHENVKDSGVEETQQQYDQPTSTQQSFMKELQDDELIALTGKDQLKQLQQAVEKRNEIIARLSSNLQDALASRDQVQSEAQSLAGQIQALQRQLQQASVEFLRIRNQSGAEVLNASKQQRDHFHHSQNKGINHKEPLSRESGSVSPTGDPELDAVWHKEERRENGQHDYVELEEERANQQHVLSSLAEEKRSWEKERQEREAQLLDLQTQLSQVQTQCLEMQQYKEEKEKLNREVLELRRRLQEEEDAERRFHEEAANYTLHVQTLEEEMKILKEEMESVRQQLQERVKELTIKEEEIIELKTSKNLHNQAKADFGCDEMVSEAEDDMNESMHKDCLMERYLSSTAPKHSQSSVVYESCDQLDISAEYSFELNSEASGDQPLLSISNRLHQESDNVCSSPLDPLANNSNPPCCWLDISASGKLEMCDVSEQQLEGTDLEKELLNQQCGELRQELALKDKDLNVLREEVLKGAEDLEEARNRWSQATEELMQALSEFEAEKERRRCLEEDMSIQAHELDNLKNNFGALLEERKETAVMSISKEVVISVNTSLLLAPTLSSEELEEQEQLPVVPLQELHGDSLIQELEETKTMAKTASALPGERSDEDTASKELETMCVQLKEVQMEAERLQEELETNQCLLDNAEKLKIEMESQILCLRRSLEEAQGKAEQESVEHKKKEREMDEQIKKMEQVLEEELEQFEKLLKAKDVELSEEREKWEEEIQEKKKDLLDVQHALEEQRREREETTERLQESHLQEINSLLDKHQQEISELNSQKEMELLKLQVTLEEEQRRQISLIKQVTEREHERMVSQLMSNHNEELGQVRTEVSLELRESMEAAHQAELQQAQAQKILELEALRMSLMDMDVTEPEVPRVNLQQELDRIRQQNQVQQERLNEINLQFETRVAKERVAIEEKHGREIQALRLECAKEAESTQSALKTSLLETQNRLTSTQKELANMQASLTKTNNALNEAQEALFQTKSELQESSARLEKLKTSSEEQNMKKEEELKQARVDREAAASALEKLVSSHKALLVERDQQALHLQERERQLHQEVLRLQEEKDLLKKSSEQEVGQLWTQLDSMRASRQELGDLKEQLLARSSRVDDIERLKMEFNEQKREIKEQNEAELESLRKYFEQRLRASEESYREEIALLQLRLVEGALEESVLQTTNCSFTSGGPTEEVKGPPPEENLILEQQEELLRSLRLQLEEKHGVELVDLQSSLALSFKEELQQARTSLTDHYYKDLQELKTRHALELEQLRAKLSERHLQEVTQVHMEAARQVEVEVEQRLWCYTEELQKTLTIIHANEKTLADLSEQHDAEILKITQKVRQELAEELANLKDELAQERKLLPETVKKITEELQVKHEAELAALRTDLVKEIEEERTCLEKTPKGEKKPPKATLDVNSAQSLIMGRELGGGGELIRENSCTHNENKELTVHLKELIEQQPPQPLGRVQEKEESEQDSTTHSHGMNTLFAKHKAQLDSFSASHRDRFVAMTMELKSKYKAELVALQSTLNSKQREDLDCLEVVFQEASRAQFEALEFELTHKHQEERDELEKRMLGNMDTLEATYLEEIQTLRDEMEQLGERHRQELNCQKTEHQQILEFNLSEQSATREELRRELAQLHMEKFRAMAAELSHVHKTELTAQKESLDAEHCKALGILKKQVFDLEQQHSASLEEFSDSCNAEKDELIKQHQLQLQELKSISARELEACRRELEEESSRQRQHFIEEVELLKVQSDERLQDRINQMKTDFEEEKEAALGNLRQSFISQQEEKECNYTGKMSQLTAQLQQLDSVVAQLHEEVGCLQGELEGKRAEMETLATLLQRRERENQEGGNLLQMLTDDLQIAKEERLQLHQANDKLKKVLIEMLHSTIATEELIEKKVNSRTDTSEQTTLQSSSMGNKNPQESGISVANMSSEDLDLTHMLCESLLISDTQISPAGEENVHNASSRLRHTVEALLELLDQADKQLKETNDVHLSLEEKFSQGREESAQLLEQHKLLLEQIDQEVKQKSRLQLELHKAEGLLEGYIAEKAMLEENLQQKEAQEEKLVEELEDLKVKVHRMQGITAQLESLRLKHQELVEENVLLLRQKEHLSAGLGEREKALLVETERLTQERLDLQRQAEKDHNSLSLRLRAVEKELEEQETKGQETELHHKTHTEDLNQRVQALEKLLKHNRQFIEEQAFEREHERDEFQQEIRQLEAQLRQSVCVDLKGHKFEDFVLQVENLQAIIKDKTDDHASLLAINQQAQRDLSERNEEIDKQAGRIRELEQALVNSAECNRSVSQLEQELHRVKLREQELTQDKQALEQQQLSNRLQISALQSKLDETRHCYHDNAHDPTQELRDALDTVQQSLQSKEQEVDVLLGQLENVQRDLSIKEVELKHLTLQLEMLTSQNAAHVDKLHAQIAALKENVSTLTVLTEEKAGQNQVEDHVEDTLPSALLEEKNHEIDHLNNEIQRMQQELENTRDMKAFETELEDLSSQVEHLRSELTRVRQDKEEEEERLHEVISTLQAELATLGPNLHEVSDSQDGDSINPSPAPSPEPPHFTSQEQERRGRPTSLKQELSLTHSASPHSLRSRFKGLQRQLDTVVAEKEALERLLHIQEEEYRGQGEKFGKSLKAEREKANELHGLLTLKEAELQAIEAIVEEEKEKRKLSEEKMNSWESKAQEADVLQVERAQLKSQLTELQQQEFNKCREFEALKTKEQEMKMEMELLRESSLTLERQVQKLRTEVVDMEDGVATERENVEKLNTIKEELAAEQEVLRRREGQLLQEIGKLRQEVTSMTTEIKNLKIQLKDKEMEQEEAQKEALTHAKVTIAKADAALRQRETELARLGTEHQALKAELTSVKQGLTSSTERAEKLHEEGQTKDRALVDLETDNQRLKAELRGLQEDLAVQEEELAYQQRELQQLKKHCHQHDTLPHHKGFSQRDISGRAFEDAVTVYQDEFSLSSPEVLRRLECSEDRIPERFHTSALGSRLSEISTLNSPGPDLPTVKNSPTVLMETVRSRTITPEAPTQSTHSPRSVTLSDNYSMHGSVDDKVQDLDELDLTTPPSPLGSTSSMSAPEWASDGYGSNVSSELGARLRVELEQTERLDANFIEYLRCRGMNPTTNTDSAAGSMSYSDDLLSPELQGLLKKVYQESCRILTLSQRRTIPSSLPCISDLEAFSSNQTQNYTEEQSYFMDQREKSSTNPPMSWQQEKRALQETVLALRELLCRMAERRTQPDSRADGEFHTQQLHTEGQIELQMRAELEENQKQLKCAHEIQQEQNNRIRSLSLTIEEHEEALRSEQSKVQELQQQLEQERAFILHKEKEVAERRGALQVSSEQQRSEVLTLKGQVEQEKVACSNLRRELQIEQSRSVLLEKRLDDTQQKLEDERQQSTKQHEITTQEKMRLEHLLTEAESRLSELHTKLADAYKKVEEERDRGTRQLEEISRRHEAEVARDRRFIVDLHAQLEQERRHGQELATGTEKVKDQLLQSRRKWEEDKMSLEEQKVDATRALEKEQEWSRCQGVELSELKEKLRVLKDREKEREAQWDREKRKSRQEQVERERRQEKTNNKLRELEVARQRDQQRMQELQRTLEELKRDEKELAAQRLSGRNAGQDPTSSQHLPTNLITDDIQAGNSQQMHQMSSMSSSGLLEKLLKENSDLTVRVTSLSQDRTTLNQKLVLLEQKLQCTENELTKVSTETENIPISDLTSHSKMQRLYERYLRAESFRKALVYQKRYLLLLLGGFQDCEQATLCLIAHMGARPSPPLSSHHRPLTRFRAAVRVVIAVSRMKFLTRKWQKAIRRLSVSGTHKGHISGSKAEILRQHPRTNSDPVPHNNTVSALVPPIKSPFRLRNRSYTSSTGASEHSAGTSLDPEKSLTDYIRHLEKVQQRLVGGSQGLSVLPPDPKKSQH